MERIYNTLYELLLEQLNEMSVGYDYNLTRLQRMTDIVNAIDFLENGSPTKLEIQQIINLYAER